MSTTLKNDIDISFFGRDHWSILAFVETVCVDAQGILTPREFSWMRCNEKKHPAYAVVARGTRPAWSNKWSTKLLDGTLVMGHDDWDCIDDLERVGLVRLWGTGLSPRFELTEKGRDVAAQLRVFKSCGGNFSAFQPILDGSLAV